MAAKKKVTKKDGDVRYIFPENSTAELTERLVSAGEGARLRVKIVNDQAYVKVIPREGIATSFDTLDDINNSHRCPPFVDCP